MKRLFVTFFLIFFVVPVLAQQAPKVTTNLNQAFISGSIVVKGEGAAPSNRPLTKAQKRIMALRAAKVVALRELSEIIEGVVVSGNTNVIDVATQSDTIRATVQGMVKGAHVIHEKYDTTSEIGTLYLSVPMTGHGGLSGQLSSSVFTAFPQSLTSTYQPQAPPVASSAPSDGLILDVTSYSFKPALINRVLAENGDLIYDPTKVDQSVLVERGAGEYTNDVGKAKALLIERGSRNPLVLRATGVFNGTDVEITGEDASRVFSANQKTNFLEGAKVVFVLK